MPRMSNVVWPGVVTLACFTEVAKCVTKEEECYIVSCPVLTDVFVRLERERLSVSSRQLEFSLSPSASLVHLAVLLY